MVLESYHSVPNGELKEKNPTREDDNGQHFSFESEHKNVEHGIKVKSWSTSAKLVCVLCSLCLLIGTIFFLLPDKIIQVSNDWCPSIAWSDEFEGPFLDTSKWSYQNGDGCDVGLCGWGNNELESYAEDNLRIINGTLIMEARHEVKDSRYTSSKILTHDKAIFGPVGRFEARIQLPRGQGIWPAFWMLPADNLYGGWPNSGEIDIMENIGKEGTNTVHGTIHYGLGGSKHQYNEEGVFLPPKQWKNFSSSFHVFAVERELGLIRWLVDDIIYSTKSKLDVAPYLWPFDEQFYFILNVAVGGTWPGNPDNTTTFPQQMKVDYVRVYNGTFPRVVGQDKVDVFSNDVVYEIVDGNQNKFEKQAGNGSLFYKWVVPIGATIKSGQGSSRILVNFGQYSGIVSAEIRIDEGGGNVSFCNDQMKKKIGIRVKVVNSTQFRDYDFDCGCPSSCTQEVLNRDADGHTCGERIQWLMEEQGKDERTACIDVSYIEQNGRCGPCYPNCYKLD